jgi:peptidoglycan/xylan/chitin deacetylase (PgdA/CDA1 family)
VLDCLAAWGATASFFCIGARAQAHPGLMRRIAAAGHGVENHTLSHRMYFACLGLRSLHAEVASAQAILAAVTGRAPRWFRAPMGLRTPLLYPVLIRASLTQATWRRRGYDTRCGDPATVLRRLLSGLTAGDVLLLHDGNAARTPDGTPVVLLVLPALLAALAERGFSAVALPDPAALPGGAAQAGAAGSPPSVAHAST